MGYMYEFTCGCKIPYIDTAITMAGIRWCGKLEHEGVSRIHKISYLCPVCGEETYHTNKTKTPIRTGSCRRLMCENCKKEERNRRNREALKKLPRKRKGRPKGSVKEVKKKKEILTRPDCKFSLTMCLKLACRDPRSQAVNCGGCKRYEHQDLDIMDFITTECLLAEGAKNFPVSPDISDKWIFRGGQKVLKKSRERGKSGWLHQK